MTETVNRENPYSEVLKEIALGLLEHAVRVEEGVAVPYSYSTESLEDCVMIFNSALLWKAWGFKISEMPQEKGIELAHEMGCAIRDLVLKYTGIDTRNIHS